MARQPVVGGLLHWAPSDAYTIVPATRKSLRLRCRGGEFSVIYFQFAILPAFTENKTVLSLGNYNTYIYD